MVEQVEREVQNIRNLLRTPTPENVELVNQKMELLASLLTLVKDSLAAGQFHDSNSRKTLARLPFEISAVRILMQGPLEFFRNLNALRAVKFGSYERTGALRSFDPGLPGKTLIHL